MRRAVDTSRSAAMRRAQSAAALLATISRAYYEGTIRGTGIGAVPRDPTHRRNVNIRGHDDGEYAEMGLLDFRQKPIAGVDVREADGAGPSSSSPSGGRGGAMRHGDIASRVEDIINRAKSAASAEQQSQQMSRHQQRRHDESSAGNGLANDRSNGRYFAEYQSQPARGRGRGRGGRDAGADAPRRYNHAHLSEEQHLFDAVDVDDNSINNTNKKAMAHRQGVVARPTEHEHVSAQPIDPRSGAPIPEERLSPLERRQRTKAADRERAGGSAAAASGDASAPTSSWSGTVTVFDCFENVVPERDVYAAGGEFTNFHDLATRILPKSAGTQLATQANSRRWAEATGLQKIAIPTLLQGRDACIVGPTGTGKSAAFLIPLVARCVAQLEGIETTGASLRAATSKGIESGRICKHCELDMAANVVCPMTGRFHPRPSAAALAAGGEGASTMVEEESDEVARASRIDDLPATTEPIGIVVVPTSMLLQQTRLTAARLAPPSVRVGYLGRATDQREGEAMMRAYNGCHLLVITPDQLATAIFKRKLSLRNVKSVVFDELSVLLESQHFEAVKVLLAALPRGDARPQRVFVGSAFPKQLREPIRNSLLHKNQRIIVASGDSVMNTNSSNGGRSKSALQANHSRSALDAAVGSLSDSVATANANTVHTVLMLSRLEKIDKLRWLYDTLKLTADQRTVVFCNSHAAVDFVVRQLRETLNFQFNVNMTQCHGRMTPQGQRAAVRGLTSGGSTCLVCTDAIGLGLDLSKVTYVVNFDMPSTFESWVNRVGRCGRMGAKGYTYSFFTPENIRLAKPLVAYLRRGAASQEAGGLQVIPPKLLEYASKDFGDLFAERNFYDANKSRSTSREENFVDITNSRPERHGHFGRDGDVTKFRRPDN